MARVYRHGERPTGQLPAATVDMPPHEADGIADQDLFASQVQGSLRDARIHRVRGPTAAQAGLLCVALVVVAEGPSLQSGPRGHCAEIPQSYNRR